MESRWSEWFISINSESVKSVYLILETEGRKEGENSFCVVSPEFRRYCTWIRFSVIQQALYCLSIPGCGPTNPYVQWVSRLLFLDPKVAGTWSCWFIYVCYIQYWDSWRIFPERPLIHLLVLGRRGNLTYLIGYTVRAQCEMTGWI